MSSAAYLYFLGYNRLISRSIFLSTRNNVLKNHCHSITSHKIASRVNHNGCEQIAKFNRCARLCSTRNARQNENKNKFKFPYYLMIIPVVIKRFFGYADDEEIDPKVVLTTTIKRSILLIKKGEKEKAEQMLHVALKMAQDQRSEEGITYVYDLMANLAFDYDEFPKAEKLFVNLLQRLIASKMDQNDNKFLHINLKLAKVYQYSKGPKECEIGYRYCLDALEKKVQQNKDDEDTVMLWCLALDWYGRFLLEQHENEAALKYLNQAHDTLLQFAGETHPQIILLLNDLGIAHSMLDNDSIAVECFEKALKLGKDMDDPLVPNIMINVGLLYLRKLKLDAANKWCTHGLEAAIKLNDSACEVEASGCLTAIKNAMKTAKP